jgi:K+-transporting ATPase ATPase C chain
MFREALGQLKTASIFLIVFTLLTGLVYPLVLTGFAQILFPNEANGSLLRQKAKVVGSRLIGQAFTSPAYFWSRPSATTPYPYNGEASAGSNFGPTNLKFLAQVKERINRLKQENPQMNTLIPVDLVTASGSGLDPEISPYAAFYQVARIAKARNLSEEVLKGLIQQQLKDRSFKLLGEPRINVLELNLALDHLDLRNGYGQTPSQP